MTAGQLPALPSTYRALFVLLLVNGAVVGWFALHAFSLSPAWGMRASGLALAALMLLTLGAVWGQKAWAAWSTLAVASGELTIILYAWATGLDRVWSIVGAVAAGTLLAVAFWSGEPQTKSLHLRQRLFFAVIVAFPAWVAVGGLFMPTQIDQFLPFVVPPLHARFIGAVYAAGATMMLFASLASVWHQVRVVTAILGIWTGLLGAVSLLHLDAFDWTWRPTWFWWFAYIWFPLGAAFIAWNQRRESSHPDEPPLPLRLRGFLVVQGVVAVMVALALLFAPGVMLGLWPWGITVLLAQIYSAPFLAYGVGSLYSARQHGWSEVRIPVIATFVLTLVAVIVSIIHRGLFDAGNPSTWVWFGGLGMVAIVLALTVALPRLHRAKAV